METFLKYMLAIVIMWIVWFFRIVILIIGASLALKLLSFLGLKFATSLLSTLF